MALFKSKTAVRTGDGVDVYTRALVSGELGIAEYAAIQAMKGRAYNISAGTVTTAITWEATATIDITKPIVWVNVPTGTAIIPVHIELYMEAFGTNAQFECNAQLGTGGSYTSGCTAVVPSNLRADKPYSSACTAYIGDNTAVVVGSTTNVSEFWHDGKQFAITKTAESATVTSFDPVKFTWSAKEMLVLPIGIGPCQFAVHQGSQAGTGFCKVQYIEIPSIELP